MDLFDLFAKISLDTKDYEKGIKKAKKSAEEYKSDVMALAKTYKKQGMNMSDAMTKAYQEIDKSQYESAEVSAKTSKKFSINWENAGEKLEKTAKKIGSALVTTTKTTANLTKEITAVGNTAANVFAGLVTTASGGIVALGKVGLDYNAQIESYVTNFATMLGNAEKAALKVDEIKTMAAKTPFGLSDLASATQTLLAFGIESDKTTGIMQQLGDISLGNAERFQSLTLAFSQATSAGKLAGQDLLQMINAGFNPLSQLVDKTGLSVGQLKEIMSGLSGEAKEAMRKTAGITEYGRKLISQGYISSDDLAYALDLATRKGGQFFGGMESASKTVSGLISTLQDDATALVGQVFEPASDKLKNKLLPSALKYVETLSKAYGNGGDGALGRIIDSASGIFAEIVVQATAQAPNLVRTATNTVKKVIASVKGRKMELREAGKVLFTELTGAFEETVDETLPLIEEFVPDIAEGFLEYGGLMFETGGKIIMSVARGLSARSGELSGTLVSVVQNGLDFVDNNAEEFATAGFNIITALATGVGENLPNFASTGVSILKKLGESFTSTEGKKKLKDGADSLINGLLGALEIVITKGNVSGIITTAATFIGALWDGFTSKEGTEALKNSAQSLLDGLLESFEILVTKENVSDVIITAAKFIDEFVGDLASTENSAKFYNAALNVGKEFAAGLWDSIPTLWDIVMNNRKEYEDFVLGTGSKESLEDDSIFGGAWKKEYADDYYEYYSEKKGNETHESSQGNVHGGGGGKFGETINITVNGANYTDENELANAIAEKLHQMKERDEVIYG